MHMPIARPTNLDALRRRYAHGETGLVRYEHELGEPFTSGTQHHPAPPLRLAGTPVPSTHTGDAAA